MKRILLPGLLSFITITTFAQADFHTAIGNKVPSFSFNF